MDKARVLKSCITALNDAVEYDIVQLVRDMSNSGATLGACDAWRNVQIARINFMAEKAIITLVVCGVEDRHIEVAYHPQDCVSVSDMADVCYVLGGIFVQMRIGVLTKIPILDDHVFDNLQDQLVTGHPSWGYSVVIPNDGYIHFDTED